MQTEEQILTKCFKSFLEKNTDPFYTEDDAYDVLAKDLYNQMRRSLLLGLENNSLKITFSSQKYNEYRLSAPYPLTKEMVQTFQKEFMKKDPAGYDFFGFRTKFEDGVYYAYWKCANSCD